MRVMNKDLKQALIVGSGMAAFLYGAGYLISVMIVYL